MVKLLNLTGPGTNLNLGCHNDIYSGNQIDIFLLKERFTSHGDNLCYKGNSADTYVRYYESELQAQLVPTHHPKAIFN